MLIVDYTRGIQDRVGPLVTSSSTQLLLDQGNIQIKAKQAVDRIGPMRHMNEIRELKTQRENRMVRGRGIVLRFVMRCTGGNIRDLFLMVDGREEDFPTQVILESRSKDF